MATKGPKSGTPTKPVVPAVKAEAVKVDQAAPKTVTAKAAKPATPKVAKPTAVAPKPVAAPVAKSVVVEPVAAEPVIAAAAPEVTPVAVAAPVAAAPVAEVVAAPVAAPTPVPTPVITPAAATAPAVKAPLLSTKKVNVIMENAIHTATEKTQALFVDMNERTKAAVEKSTQLFADMNDFSKGNVEALVESSKIAAKGIETMGQEAADYTRKSFEGATAAMRDLASVKTPADFMKLQSDFVRTAFDSLVAETSKTTEAMLKLAGDVAQPISNRVAVAAEKIKVSA